MDTPYSQAGQDPTQQSGLLQILQQIQAMQSQPLIADNPLSQLGAALQGASAGFAGQPNPAIQQALAQRQQQMAGLSQTAGILGSLASMQHQQATLAETRRARAVQEEAEARKAAHEVRTQEEKRVEVSLKLIDRYLNSESDDERRFATGELNRLIGQAGMRVPPGVGSNALTKPLKPEDRKMILRMLFEGNAPEIVAQATGHSLSTVEMLAKIPDTPAMRRPLQMPTAEELRRQQQDNEIKDLDTIRRRQVIENPEADKWTHQAAKTLFGKNYFELADEKQRKRALEAGHQLAIEQSYGKAYSDATARFNAKLHQPVGDEADRWLNKDTYEPVDPKATEAELIASKKYVPVKDPQVRRQLGQVRQVLLMMNQVQEVYENRPEWYPKSTGNAVQDYANLALAKAQYTASQMREPDIATIKTAMGRIPMLARLASEVGNLAQNEQKLQQDAAGLGGVDLREYKLASLRALRQYVEAQLGAAGFNPPPAYVPVLRGKAHTGRIVDVPIDEVRGQK